MQDFYKRFISFDDETLFKIVMTPEEYNTQAIETARKIIKERGLQEELLVQLKEQAVTKELQEQRDYEEIVEKSGYYTQVVEFKNSGVSFDIRVSDIPKFESELIDQGIEFHREDKHIGAQLDAYPTQMYYFKKSDGDAVDQIVKRIELITTPHLYHNHYFKFEIVAIVLAIVLAILLFFTGVII